MFVSVAIVRGIVAELERAGISPQAVLDHNGLTTQQLADMQTMLPVERYAAIVAHAFELTRDPGLGLRVGMHAPETMFQLVAHLALAVPTLRDAMHALARYGGLLVDGLHMHIHEHRGISELRYEFHSAVDASTVRFGTECFSTVCVRAAQRHFTSAQRPRFVGFRHPEPDYAERYAAVFGCPVLFDQTANIIAFDSELLDRPPPYSDRSMADILSHAADQLLRTVGQRATLSERVRVMLRREDDLCNVDTERLAHELGLSHRMMRRRLASEGQPLSTLLEEARIAGALAALQLPGSTIKATAERLGYSEPSAFQRAFKRWTGETPGRFMREHAAR